STRYDAACSARNDAIRTPTTSRNDATWTSSTSWNDASTWTSWNDATTWSTWNDATTWSSWNDATSSWTSRYARNASKGYATNDGNGIRWSSETKAYKTSHKTCEKTSKFQLEKSFGVLGFW